MDAQGPILIIGGGPTGIGAALRLTELGCEHWMLMDRGAAIGGLSRSFQDEKGFTWDIGGHVIFSHYQYFDDLMDAAFTRAGEADRTVGWTHLQRESWVRACGTWVPYPFQLNIHRLPPAARQDCLEGLEAIAAANRSAEPPVDSFEAFIRTHFGAGIARHFMMPYNFKVWAVPPSEMTASWMGERVAAVDLARVRRNVQTGEDDVGWGPNATFRFPTRGGTGAIYRALQEKFLPRERLRLGGHGPSSDAETAAATVVGIRPSARTARTLDGREVRYGTLISSMPLDDLLRMVADGLEAEAEAGEGGGGPGWLTPVELRAHADALVSNTTYVIGFGLRGQPPTHLRTSCWMYFPGGETPFYRCTVFSNYAAANVPVPGEHWSLMLEVNYTPRFKPETLSRNELVDACLRGCVAADLLTAEDAADRVVSVFVHREAKGYPIPSLGRDAALQAVQPWLRDALGIYSRGRFGGWRYEVANQDHSLMQGVEAVDAVMLRLAAEKGTATTDGAYPRTRKVRLGAREVSLVEGEPTYHNPTYVNTTRGMMPCTLAR